MSIAVSAKGLSKLYRIGANATGYRTLRETITERLTSPLNRLRANTDGASSTSRNGKEDFWALKDATFEVEQGQVVGFVGRNGAGKSTLLKILSRITEPTGGRAELRGRVGSLLEVGTGFHPELTGRENIYLNGAILGMSRRQINQRFDAIVDFADIGPFLDTPVKRYSSGMHVRLAFAVASHLEPEILVIDEVLAVGDAAFQQKCLGRMGQVSREGRTVLFVSHNMAAVKSLCDRAVLLEDGQVTLDGDVNDVVNRYLAAGTGTASRGFIADDAPRYSDNPDEARIRAVRLTDPQGRLSSRLYFAQPFAVEMTCEVFRSLDDALFEASISTSDGTHVTYSSTADDTNQMLALEPGTYSIRFEFENLLLPNDYTIDVGIHHADGRTLDLVTRTWDFSVLRVAEQGDVHYRWPRTRGLVQLPRRWTWRRSQDNESPQSHDDLTGSRR